VVAHCGFRSCRTVIPGYAAHPFRSMSHSQERGKAG
jgi:hypothetical protein